MFLGRNASPRKNNVGTRIVGRWPKLRSMSVDKRDLLLGVIRSGENVSYTQFMQIWWYGRTVLYLVWPFWTLKWGSWDFPESVQNFLKIWKVKKATIPTTEGLLCIENERRGIAQENNSFVRATNTWSATVKFGKDPNCLYFKVRKRSALVCEMCTLNGVGVYRMVFSRGSGEKSEESLVAWSKAEARNCFPCY